ncbi:MAG: recombinase family protein [Armatimonadota bacterium]
MNDIQIEEYPTKYAIYLRSNAGAQSESDHFTKIVQQREATTAFVHERGGIVVQEYVCESSSASAASKELINRMIRDARKGSFATVCVTDLSRLGRDAGATEHRLIEERISVECVDGSHTLKMKNHVLKMVSGVKWYRRPPV